MREAASFAERLGPAGDGLVASASRGYVTEHRVGLPGIPRASEVVQQGRLAVHPLQALVFGAPLVHTSRPIFGRVRAGLRPGGSGGQRCPEQRGCAFEHPTVIAIKGFTAVAGNDTLGRSRS